MTTFCEPAEDYVPTIDDHAISQQFEVQDEFMIVMWNAQIMLAFHRTLIES
jgi:hypothetical protein